MSLPRAVHIDILETLSLPPVKLVAFRTKASVAEVPRTQPEAPAVFRLVVSLATVAYVTAMLMVLWSPVVVFVDGGLGIWKVFST